MRDRVCVDEQLRRRLGLAVFKLTAELRADRSGAKHRNVDAQRFKLVVKALRPAVHGEFRRAVTRHVERADLAGPRGDIDDMARPSGDHRWQDCVGAINRAEIIRPHDRFNSFHRRVDEGFAHADTGVVNQDIDPAEVGEHFIHHAVDLLGVANVARDHQRLGTGLANFFESFDQPFARAAAADGNGASGGEIDGELFADAARSTGDEDDAISKVHKKKSFPQKRKVRNVGG